MKLTVIVIVIGAFATGSGELGNKRTSGDHPDYCFIKIGQNTLKSPGDLRGFVVTQTPVKNYRLMLVRKILERVIMITILMIIMIRQDGTK